MANSADQDQLPQNVTSNLGQHCLLRGINLKFRIEMKNIHFTPLNFQELHHEKTCFSHICENKDADQLCDDRAADQRLCFRYTDSTIPLPFESEISSI